MNRSRLTGAAVAGTGLLLALGTVSGAAAPQVCAQPAGGVQVCKTVIMTKQYTWNWGVQKTANPAALQLGVGASAPISYTISATPTQSVSWYISGAVIVKNQTGAPVTGVDAFDTLKIPGSPDQTVQVADNQTVPVAVPGGSNGERHFDYGVVVQSGAPGATNVGSATWNGGGSGSVTAPVSFENPPNEVAYNRKVTLADVFGSLEGTGLGIGAPSDPGPWTLEADNPATLTKTLSVDVTNQGLPAGQTAAIANTATIKYITQEPEVIKLDDASVKNIPLGIPVNAATQASVPVTAVGAPPTPPATPATPSSPATAPLVPLVSATKTTPKKAARSVCPRPLLGMSLLGPRSLTAGQLVTYTLRVSNRAKNPAKNTVINYPIPSGFSVVSSTGASAKTIRSASVRLSVGTVPANGSKTVKVVMRVDSTTAGNKVNRARASSGSCGATAAATMPINVKAIGAAVTPAVTG